MGVSFDVKVSGPLFDTGSAQRAHQGVVRVVKKLMEVGQTRLAQTLRKRPEGVYLEDGGSTGNYRRNVQPVFQDDLNALITDGGVVYGPWLEGTSSRNESTRFKGYASFRRTAEWLQAQADGFIATEAQVIATELGG